MNATFLTKAGRVKEERKRLGLTQAEAAVQSGLSRSMWIRYEQGQSDFDGAALRAFGAIGADTAYILTGVKSSPHELLQLQTTAKLAENMPNGEQFFNEMSEATAQGAMIRARNQAQILQIAKSLEQFSQQDLNNVQRIVEGLWLAQVKEIMDEKK